MNREEFLIKFHHACWICAQIMLGEEYDKELPEYKREPLRDFIRALEKNPDMNPKESHDALVELYHEAGWRYGPVTDLEKKENPDLVHYDRLPDIEKRRYEQALIANKLGVELWDEISWDAYYREIEICRDCHR